MKIGIIGGGALGLLCSSYLSKHHIITLYVKREAQQTAITNEQISLSIQGEEAFTTKHVTAKFIKQLEGIDCIIIAVKQSGIYQVMQQLNSLNHEIPLLFLQNGMGHLEALRASKHPAYVGVVQHGAVRESDRSVNHLGVGTIKLAAITGTKAKVEVLQHHLHTEEFPFEIENDWEQVMKEKLIVNAIINPLTALFDVENRAIIDNEHIRNLAIKLCAEAALVLEIDEDNAWRLVEEVAHNTGENTSSMRADIQREKKTEIEAISGYILNQTKEPLPYTRFIYEAVLAIEREAVT